MDSIIKKILFSFVFATSILNMNAMVMTTPIKCYPSSGCVSSILQKLREDEDFGSASRDSTMNLNAFIADTSSIPTMHRNVFLIDEPKGGYPDSTSIEEIKKAQWTGVRVEKDGGIVFELRKDPATKIFTLSVGDKILAFGFSIQLKKGETVQGTTPKADVSIDIETQELDVIDILSRAF